MEPGTIMFRIKYLMKGCIDHEPTSLLKEYHIYQNIPPKDNQENPFITQIIKEINYHHNQITITLAMKRFTLHQQSQSKSELIILQG